MSTVIRLTHPASRSGFRSPSCFTRLRRPPASLGTPNSKLRHGFLPAVRAVSSTGDAHQNPDDIKEPTSQPNSPAPASAGAPEPVHGEKAPKPKSLFTIISWVVGSLFCVAIPFYKNLKVAEDIFVVIASKVANQIQEKAPIVKNIAEEIEKSLPKDSKLIPKLDFIEKLADDAKKGAEKAEDFVEKVDQIFDKVEETIDPFIKVEENKDNK